MARFNVNRQNSAVANVLLRVTNVGKHFGGLHALSAIDLAIEEGKTRAIIGPNGAGKSTLLNVCVGRIRPDTGSVTFEGKAITGKTPYQINQLGIGRVFQTPEIFPSLSVVENVMVPAFAKRDGAFRIRAWQDVAHETELREQAIRAIEDVGLHDRLANEAGSLSRGDKRRLELAMTLVQHPRLMLRELRQLL